MGLKAKRCFEKKDLLFLWFFFSRRKIWKILGKLVVNHTTDVGQIQK